MILAAYTITKNEINRIDRWIQYASMFDYMVVLDTGSTDGTWEKLKMLSKTNPKLIIEQIIFSPFDFSRARNYNLSMIPKHVNWCLSPDMDEWFSINVKDEIQNIIFEDPTVTNITTTRLDIYSKDVFVGPPNHTPSNKIHKNGMYKWKSPIYEHLWPLNLEKHKEHFSPKIYLVHDQETDKPRSNLYVNIMERRFAEDHTDCWNNWFLLNHYYMTKNLAKYINVALCYLKHSDDRNSQKYKEVRDDIDMMYLNMQSDVSVRPYIQRMKEILDEIN